MYSASVIRAPNSPNLPAEVMAVRNMTSSDRQDMEHMISGSKGDLEDLSEGLVTLLVQSF